MIDSPDLAAPVRWGGFLVGGARTISRCMGANYRAQFWRGMAEQTRAAAKSVPNFDLKLHILLIAARYLAWARRAESDDRAAAPDRRKGPYGP